MAPLGPEGGHGHGREARLLFQNSETDVQPFSSECSESFSAQQGEETGSDSEAGCAFAVRDFRTRLSGQPNGKGC